MKNVITTMLTSFGLIGTLIPFFALISFEDISYNQNIIFVGMIIIFGITMTINIICDFFE